MVGLCLEKCQCSGAWGGAPQAEVNTEALFLESSLEGQCPETPL